MSRPEDLAAVPLRELASAWEGHMAALAEARREPGRVRAAALHALVVATAIITRLSMSRWPTAYRAVELGADLAEVAVSIGEVDDVDTVAERLRAWADSQVIEGEMTHPQRDALERRLPPRPTRRGPVWLDPDQLDDCMLLSDAVYAEVGVQLDLDAVAAALRTARGAR